MKRHQPDKNGVVMVQGILSEGIGDCSLVVPPCECCGSRVDWSLFWLPEKWRDHTVVVTVRLAREDEL